MEQLRKQYPLSVMREQEPLSAGAEETSQSNQRSVLIRRGFMKAKRDSVSEKPLTNFIVKVEYMMNETSRFSLYKRAVSCHGILVRDGSLILFLDNSLINRQ